MYFDKTLKLLNGKVNTFFHFREPMSLDDPAVIRSNRDTLYSGVIVDISKGATLTIPETDGRYVSVMVVNEDHYLNKMFHGQGTYQLSMETFDTPYVIVTIRTLVDASDPEDIKKVRAIQDGMALKANSSHDLFWRGFVTAIFPHDHAAMELHASPLSSGSPIF